MEQATAASLPQPPPDKVASPSGAPPPQTQADKIVEKYSQIGQQEHHAYGVLGSNLPNFNVKPANQTGAAKPAAAASLQGVLGAPRPTANGTKPSSALPAAASTNRSSGPAFAADQKRSSAPPSTPLPLGAPRHKTASAQP
jgi:hypothetical protein